MSRHRVNQSLEHRLGALETHLFYLWEASVLCERQPDRIRQVATELRILVADAKASRRLLLRAMDDVGFRWEVASRLVFPELPVARVKHRRPERVATNPLALELTDYVEVAHAATINRKNLSYGELVRRVAEQLGGTHEDRAVDLHLAQAAAMTIGGRPAHVAALLVFSKTILAAGLAFLGFLVHRNAYRLRYFETAGTKVVEPAVRDGRKARRVAPTSEPRDQSVDQREQGTLMFRLLLRERACLADSECYELGSFGAGRTLLRLTKRPDRRLQLTLEREEHPTWFAIAPAREFGEHPVPIVASWKEGKVYFLLGDDYHEGQPVDRVSATLPPTEPEP